MAPREPKFAAEPGCEHQQSVDAARFSNSRVTPNKKKEEEKGLDAKEILLLQRFFLLLDQWEREGKA
jgi:hypothetical protein